MNDLGLGWSWWSWVVGILSGFLLIIAWKDFELWLENKIKRQLNHKQKTKPPRRKK